MIARIGIVASAIQKRVLLELVISANTQNVNVQTLAEAHPNYLAGQSDVVLTVNPGVFVGGSSTGVWAMRTGTAPAGNTLLIVNNGTILGAGGAGGVGGSSVFSGSYSHTPAGAGGSGGGAILLEYATSVDNQGSIYGGGGGGGGGGALTNLYGTGKPSCSLISSKGGGGGGGGAGYNAGGAGGGGSGQQASGASGTGGSTLTGGAGGAGAVHGDGANAGNGGAGGAIGVGGTGGGTGTNPTGCPTSIISGGASAGAAGFYMSGGGTYATWVNTGTVGGQYV